MPGFSPIERAAQAIVARLPDLPEQDVEITAIAVVQAAIGNRDDLSRVLHASDLSAGRAGLEFDEMDPDAREWYDDNAAAVIAHLLSKEPMQP